MADGPREGQNNGLNMTLVYGLIVGTRMGVLLQSVGASSPSAIARNLRLENLSIIMFMAAAIAVGSVGVYLLVALGVPMHLDIKPTYLLGVVLGGLIFGVGFALGGYCPGTCVVGAGEGRRDAWWAILGALAGALVFMLLYSVLEAPLVRSVNYGKVTLASALQLPPLAVALALAGMIVTVLAFLPTDLARK